MDRLGRLWIEMFQYEKMPEAPEREQVLVILDQGQRKLAEEAAGMMLAGKGWRIRVTDRLPELAERDIQAQYWVLAEGSRKGICAAGGQFAHLSESLWTGRERVSAFS